MAGLGSEPRAGRATALYRGFRLERERRWDAFSPAARGILMIVLSGLCFSAMGAMSKYLGGRLSYFEVAFFRSIFGWMMVWPFLLKAGLGQLRTNRPIPHIARGVASGFSVLAIFYGVVHLPLADATAYGFTRNLFIVVLAALFLREPLRWDRSLIALLGFAGVLMMLRPQGGVGVDSIVVLGGALMAAGVIIIVKQLMRSEAPVAVMFYFGLATTVITGLPTIWFWKAPTLPELSLLVVVGALGTLGQSAMILAYRVADATVLAPFDYLQLVFAAAFGLLVFSEAPTAWGMGGAALIIAANLYNTYRGNVDAVGRMAGPK